MPKRNDYILFNENLRVAMRAYFGSPKHAYQTLGLNLSLLAVPFPIFMRVWQGYPVLPSYEEITRRALLLWCDRNSPPPPSAWTLTQDDIDCITSTPDDTARPDATDAEFDAKHAEMLRRTQANIDAGLAELLARDTDR